MLPISSPPHPALLSASFLCQYDPPCMSLPAQAPLGLARWLCVLPPFFIRCCVPPCRALRHLPNLCRNPLPSSPQSSCIPHSSFMCPKLSDLVSCASHYPFSTPLSFPTSDSFVVSGLVPAHRSFPGSLPLFSWHPSLTLILCAVSSNLPHPRRSLSYGLLGFGR